MFKIFDLLKSKFKCNIVEQNKTYDEISISTNKITNKPRIIKRKNPHWRLSINQKDIYNFLKWIYYPKHKLSLDRKFNKAKLVFELKENNDALLRFFDNISDSASLLETK